jgi:hypothetical protein
MRHGLDGQPVEQVNDEHREAAKGRLAEMASSPVK